MKKSKKVRTPRKKRTPPGLGVLRTVRHLLSLKDPVITHEIRLIANALRKDVKLRKEGKADQARSAWARFEQAQRQRLARHGFDVSALGKDK